MTIGEKSILGVILKFLRNNDLISDEALDEAFEKLKLPQEYKGYIESECFNLMNETQHLVELNKSQ